MNFTSKFFSLPEAVADKTNKLWMVYMMSWPFSLFFTENSPPHCCPIHSACAQPQPAGMLCAQHLLLCTVGPRGNHAISYEVSKIRNFSQDSPLQALCKVFQQPTDSQLPAENFLLCLWAAPALRLLSSRLAAPSSHTLTPVLGTTSTKKLKKELQTGQGWFCSLIACCLAGY